MPVSVDDVIAYVAQHRACYKQIRAVDFIARIPTFPSGEILRCMLKG